MIYIPLEAGLTLLAALAFLVASSKQGKNRGGWIVTKPEYTTPIEGVYERSQREGKQAAKDSENYRSHSFARDIISKYGDRAPRNPRTIVRDVDAEVREHDAGNEDLPPGYSMKRTELLTLDRVAGHYGRHRLEKATETLLEEGKLTKLGRAFGLGKIASIGEPRKYGVKDHARDTVKGIGRGAKDAVDDTVNATKQKILPSKYK